MRYLLNIIALLLLASPAFADSPARLRYLSFAVRDMPPTVDESKAFAAGETNAEALIASWLATDAHEKKVKRFFYDLMGTRNFSLGAGVRILKNTDGVYYLKEKGDCAKTAAVSASVWWKEASETVLVCPSTQSAAIQFDNPGIACVLPGEMLDARCGCGPKHIACFPEDEEVRMWNQMHEEFTERGLLMYKEGRGWLDLFAGSNFYGSRTMYYFYLWYNSIYNNGTLPTTEEWAKLAGLPMDGRGEVTYPTQGPVRAPVVTDPNFMVQYNNFRSRVRALSERLLCQDISSALNTSGIQSFVNSDLGSFNLDHGSKPSCSGCHFAMDNLGSTILGWADNGMLASYTLPSQLGHVFGQDGSGPQFLMKGIIERGPGFQTCMARRAYEVMTGGDWKTLDTSFQDKLNQLAGQGPRALLRGLLSAPELLDQR